MAQRPFDLTPDFSVTRRDKSRKAPGMLRWSFLLLCLVMTSLTATSVLHAGEIPGAFTVECTGNVHGEDDGDRSQGEADKAVQHHGGCHHAAALLPFRLGSADAMKPLPTPLLRAATSALGRWSADPGLRPPIA